MKVGAFANPRTNVLRWNAFSFWQRGMNRDMAKDSRLAYDHPVTRVFATVNWKIFFILLGVVAVIP